MKQMKHSNKIFPLLFSFVALLISGCKDDDSINTNITPVQALYGPEDNKFVKLEPATNATLLFEWDRALAEDGTFVMYEVAFDKENGDFSAPLYKLVSDSKGAESKLTLSHKDLDKVAKLAGIKYFETGKLKWTVLASKGVNVQPAASARVLEVQRPIGYETIPTQLFLTGSATEGGATLAQAIPMKQVSEGAFELYTSLQPGTYKFVDATTGTPADFYIDGAFIKEDGENTVGAGDTKVYRIEINFNYASALLTEIASVGLWFSPENKILYEIPYDGNSTWSLPDAYIEFHQEGWGRDERYKFRFTVKDSDGNESMEWYGSVNSDNSRPDGNTSPAYWNIVPVNSSQYDYAFKFTSGADYHDCDINVLFKADAPYTHQIIVN